VNISHKIAVGDNKLRTLTSAPAPIRPQTHRLRLALVCLSLILPLLTGACSEVPSIATVQTESEAIEILNVLNENGLKAHKNAVGEEGSKQWRIVLDGSWFGGAEEGALAHQVLQDNGLPRPTNATASQAADGGMFKDEATRKAEQLKEREAELQRKLRLLPGVIGVEVSVVEPEDSAININPYPSTASVLIVSKDDPPSFDQATVKGLVARSVPKLNPDSVYVAITTKPVRPLPWREIGAQRRHKILDAIGIGIMIILGSSLAVLLLQMRRQSNDLQALREEEKSEPVAGYETPNEELAVTSDKGIGDSQALGRATNPDVAPTTT
jgi:type III secretory pathway lipoprotein EscJ